MDVLRALCCLEEAILKKSVVTRFRAYQLGSSGSSFSYYAGGHFTQLEGRLTELSRLSLVAEMKQCSVAVADLLHITSWDEDHCSANELGDLLDLIVPKKIECPGYEPQSDNGKKARRIIEAFRASRQSTNRAVKIQAVTPEYIDGLGNAEAVAFNDVFYNPRFIDPDCMNNNSTVKFFRGGSFNVLSLGDVENQNISAQLRRSPYLKRETDIMILAHHGADNGFTNKKFLERIDPKLAICSSDYGNQYEHPKEEIRNLLHELGFAL